jgi:hypothetical protein
MRRILFVVLIELLSGCSTQHFNSQHSSLVVATCIASRWEKVGMAGTIPVLIERQDNGYFVAVFLGWLLIPSGLKHPAYPVWAEVTDTVSGGSTTEYHWAMQIMHGKLDKSVLDCQEQQQ